MVVELFNLTESGNFARQKVAFEDMGDSDVFLIAEDFGAARWPHANMWKLSAAPKVSTKGPVFTRVIQLYEGARDPHTLKQGTQHTSHLCACAL